MLTCCSQTGLSGVLTFPGCSLQAPACLDIGLLKECSAVYATNLSKRPTPAAELGHFA